MKLEGFTEDVDGGGIPFSHTVTKRRVRGAAILGRLPFSVKPSSRVLLAPVGLTVDEAAQVLNVEWGAVSWEVRGQRVIWLTREEPLGTGSRRAAPMLEGANVERLAAWQLRRLVCALDGAPAAGVIVRDESPARMDLLASAAAAMVDGWLRAVMAAGAPFETFDELAAEILDRRRASDCDPVAATVPGGSASVAYFGVELPTHKERGGCSHAAAEQIAGGLLVEEEFSGIEWCSSCGAYRKRAGGWSEWRSPDGLGGRE